jgi:hypothetical protein
VRLVDGHGYHLHGITSTFTPLLAAADALGADVDWPAVDLLSDRNGLRKLLNWIAGARESRLAAGDADGEFRIDLELVGEKTMLLRRWERNFWQVSRYASYGKRFEEAVASIAPECADGVSHHRAVKYVRFGSYRASCYC